MHYEKNPSNIIKQLLFSYSKIKEKVNGIL